MKYYLLKLQKISQNKLLYARLKKWEKKKKIWTVIKSFFPSIILVNFLSFSFFYLKGYSKIILLEQKIDNKLGRF